MNTENYIYYPVKKFIERYKAQKNIRLHMPGHKGAFNYGDDITEIKGADSLYEANGIIADSERKTAEMFGAANSFYSTEGSSQVIKAMCFLAVQRFYSLHGSAASVGEMAGNQNDKPDGAIIRPTILATRNAHKSFIYASMLLGFNIKWLMDGEEFSLCKCNITADGLNRKLQDMEVADVAAVYVTSPDYLGNILDVKELAEVAHKYGLPLLVDNAHGSYLKFMKKDLHPVSLGADIVADSAHKTLPVMTGGAYLHVSKESLFLKMNNGQYVTNGQVIGLISEDFSAEIRKALLMFGSTSPSYVIMESMDEALGRIDVGEYRKTQDRVETLKHELSKMGYNILGLGSEMNEPLKVVIDLNSYGKGEDGKNGGNEVVSGERFRAQISGEQLSDMLRNHGIECEYADPDFLVTMWSPYNEYPADFDSFKNAMEDIMNHVGNELEAAKEKDFGKIHLEGYSLPKVKYQPYEIMYRPHYREKVGPNLIGKIAADTSVSCPPAVSPIVAGEVIDENSIKVLQYYGIESVEVLR